MYCMLAPDFSVYDDTPQFLNPPHYGAAKAGVLQLSSYYASYMGNEGITVNCVTPGPYPSPKVQDEQVPIDHRHAKTRLKRNGKTEDLAGAIINLASNAECNVNAQTMDVDREL